MCTVGWGIKKVGLRPSPPIRPSLGIQDGPDALMDTKKGLCREWICPSPLPPWDLYDIAFVSLRGGSVYITRYLLEEGRCFAQQILVLSQNKILINHLLDHRPPQPPLLARAVCFNFHSSLIPRVLQNFAQSLSGIIYISTTPWNFKLWLFMTKSDSWAVELQFHNPMMSLMTFHKWRVADSILHTHPLLKLPIIECIC